MRDETDFRKIFNCPKCDNRGEYESALATSPETHIQYWVCWPCGRVWEVRSFGKAPAGTRRAPYYRNVVIKN